MRKMLVLLCLLALHATACTSVRAWERETLAKPEMGWEPNAQGATLESHIRFSKEASLRGGSAGGGGCGCN